MYERIAIDRLDAEHGRGYSEALGLYVRWERDELRFCDPMSGRYLRTLDEEAKRWADAEGRWRADEARWQAKARAAAD